MIDLVRLFTREELVAGISIDDSAVRLVLLARDPIKKRVFIKCIEENHLRPGVLVDGEIKDRVAFQVAIKELVGNSNCKARYAILSIPQARSYSKIFSFPKNIDGEKLDEAMKVSINFNLPVKTDDVYLDWEKTESEARNELILATMPKEIINPYLEVLPLAGIKPVAVETHLLSGLRAIDSPESEAVLLMEREADFTVFSVIRGKTFYFTRIIKSALSDETLLQEAEKTAMFYEVQYGMKPKVLDMKDAPLGRKFKNHPKVKESPREWLPALGAAMRGLLPRSEDKLISLMDIGTEKAYEIEKRRVFIKLLSDLTIAVSAIISVAFIAVWTLMISIQNNLDAQFGTVSPVPTDGLVAEERVKKLNSLSVALIDIDKQSPRWSRAIAELRANEPDEIVINNFSVTSASGSFTINGLASNRSAMNEFRKTLETTALFSSVNIPLGNLDKRTNIPFSATFRVEDFNLLTKPSDL